MSNLLFFYGTECHFCRMMEPFVEKLQNEEHVTLDKFETWHNEENARKLAEYDKNFCGGVPFFYNTKTNQWICGATSYEKLKEWALG